MVVRVENFIIIHRIVLLRLAIGFVYLWFGLLKVFDVSPLKDMISQSYFFLPYESFRFVIGGLECVIGVILLANFKIRWAVYLLWMQMAGV